MEILVTNDDGWGVGGILALIQAVKPLGHLTVVVPDGPRSGRGSSISVGTPMYLSKMETQEERFQGVDIYLTNGTPADCIKLAINALYGGDDTKIDLVVSGINHGHNASCNLIYSGTMGACFVATEHAIPSIGFSLNDMEADADFSHFIHYIPDIIQHLMEEGFPKPCICYNINAPKGEIQGLQWTRQCDGRWEKELEPHVDDQGRTYYMLIGSFINQEPESQDTDLWALAHNYISIQPVTIDMTAYAAL